MSNNSFFIPNKIAEGLYKEKGSKFIAFIFPVKTEDEIKKNLAELKKQHFTANHHCYAYRIGTVDIKFRANDDGEPSNSAGKPILAQLLSHNISNALIVVVRYFGGTLLGVSGLINAYKNAAIEAINNAQLIEHTVENYYKVLFDFTQINDVMRILKTFSTKIIAQNTNTGYELTIAVAIANSDKLSESLKKILNLEIMFLYTE